VPFEITITETREVKKMVGGEWAVLDTKEVAREKEFFERETNEPKTRIKEIHGYTPQFERIIPEKREVLKQMVDELDLPAVIRAINKL